MNADAPAHGRTRLLMIDDDKKLCRLVGAYLEPLGFDVVPVHSGPEGVERATAPDAVTAEEPLAEWERELLAGSADEAVVTEAVVTEAVVEVVEAPDGTVVAEVVEVIEAPTAE